ncbi:MAG: head-tail adaptor protein [Paracoccus sp. (in: a-proteobacteria)]|uniref:head-tail adaptor protein n=1 Tax=Paracoccus sp. TaxID=267 RepID=UPI0039E63B48
MSPPRLSVPLVLEASVREPDGMGGFTLAWQSVSRFWAEMRSGAGGEKFAEVGARSVVTWRILIRSVRAGDPRRPRPEQRLVMGEGVHQRCFRIEAVAEADNLGRYLVCFAKEETAA